MRRIIELRLGLLWKQPNSSWFHKTLHIPSSESKITHTHTQPCEWSLSSQPTSIWKVQSRKKSPHTVPLRTSWISPKMCQPCLMIIKSCYFDYRTNKPFPCSHCLICVSCSVHVISTYNASKGSSRLFYLNCPNIRGWKIQSHGSQVQCIYDAILHGPSCEN